MAKLIPALVSDGPTAPRPRAVMAPARPRTWHLIAAAVVLAGSIGAGLAGRAAAAQNVSSSHRDFAITTEYIATSLLVAVAHQDDLNVSAGALVLRNKNTTNAEFTAWASDIQAFHRYPALVGFGFTTLVPAAQLPAFQAHAVSDPAGSLGLDGSYSVSPPGARPYYCLAKLALMRPGAGAIPAGYDYCATHPSLETRDTGLDSYVPLHVGGQTALVIQTPIYQRGVTPPTVAERRVNFVGWIDMLVSPDALLTQALGGRPYTAASLHYGAGATAVEFRMGIAPQRAQSTTRDLHNGWNLTAYGAVPDGHVMSNPAATTVVASGVAFSLLLGLLIYVLSTGRARALTMVEQKTKQLQRQALHDPLTDLPNRALIMDRLDRMLAHARRDGTSMAVLFVDLDDFKNVNDTLGHAAGDQLLQTVASRLTTTVRDADTIGRLGGDEFIILVGGNAAALEPEAVGKRVLSVMRQPFWLDGSPPMMVTASIGIAFGSTATADELLREADVALYRAKAAGRNCYQLFCDETGPSGQDHRDPDPDLHRTLEA